MQNSKYDMQTDTPNIIKDKRLITNTIEYSSLRLERIIYTQWNIPL
jgi:hypothetical protein